MRLIGYLQNESDARTFSDFLYVQGIKNNIEAESEGHWAVWIHGEDEISPARSLLQKYLENPKNPDYHEAAKQAHQQREQEEQRDSEAEKRHFDTRRIFRARGPFGVGPVTFALLSICVVVWGLMEIGGLRDWFHEHFLISRDSFRRNLPEVRQGEVWRIITPIFLHGPWWHLLLNMLALLSLGSMVESRQGSAFLIRMALVVAVVSNLAQYFIVIPSFGSTSDPRSLGVSNLDFGGISGVLFGLFGYIWMKAKFDFASGYFMDPSTVVLMLAFFLFGFTNILSIANTVHAAGLVLGMAWGYLSATRPFSS